MMRGRVTFGDATVSEAQATPKLFDHVAIDRFTGGAADSKKFDMRPLLPTEDALFAGQMKLDHFEPWMLGLLGHLLKDLRLGDLRFGHGSRRGYGRVRGWVTTAELWVLPNTRLHALCQTTGVALSETSGPYWRGQLDFDDFFGLLQGTPSGSVAATPTIRLLLACDEEFQKLVEAEELREHGEVPHV
jgi:hypothetical protein